MNFALTNSIAVKTVVMSTALFFGSCNENAKQQETPSIDAPTIHKTATDHALGSVTAPITLVEYASLTCPTCAAWSLRVFPELQKKYINTGKVRFIFREFTTAPVDLARAGHLLTNCAPEEQYFDLLHSQFKSQATLMVSSDIKGEFIKLAKSVGMSEADFDACMVNQDEIDKLQAVVKAGTEAGVRGTPTFFINGQQIPAGTFDLKDFEEIFVQALEKQK